MSISDTQIAKAFTNDTLRLIVFPTEQCNFRCVYCYEKFELGKMPVELVGGLKKLVASRANDLRHLQLSWFGGEPLAASDIVLEVLEYAKKLGEEKGFVVESDTTTNASLLSRELFESLLSYDLRSYQITLDGPKEIHDKTRVRANGSGTFDIIWHNLLEMKKVVGDFYVTVRVHVSPDNIEVMPSFLSFVREKLLDDERFRLSVIPIGKWGGPNDELLEVFDSKTGTNVVSDLLQSLDISPDSIEGDDHICYAAMPNSYAIRSSGGIQKCTLMLYKESNNVGHLTPDGEIVLNENATKWLDGWSDLNPDKLGCPAAHVEFSKL